MASLGRRIFPSREGKHGEERKLRKERDKIMAQHATEGFINAPDAILADLPAATVNQLHGQVLEKLPFERQKTLSPGALARLSTDTLCKLPMEVILRLPVPRLNTLPPSFLKQLTPWNLSKLSPQTLSMVLLVLDLKDLTAVSWSDIAKVHPQDLARIPSQGLAALDKRHPHDFHRLFMELPNDQLLTLPPCVLDKLPFERFQKIPGEVWSAQPHEVLNNLPPDVQKLLPEEVWGSREAQTGPPPTASSLENQFLSSISGPLDFPQNFLHDSNLEPEVVPQAVPPLVPSKAPRGGPPSSHANKTLTRTSSMSSTRAQVQGASPDHRNQAALYIESMFPPERKSSKSTIDVGAPREAPTHRGARSTPDGIARKEVHGVHRITDQRSQDAIAKDKRIEELESQIKEKDSWWKQRLEEDRESQNDKIVNLRVRIKSSADRIFNALASMEPEGNWDRSHPDPVALIISFSEDLKEWKRSSLESFDRIFDYLDSVPSLMGVGSPEGVDSKPRWDRKVADPVTEILKYVKVVHENANFNFGNAEQWRGACDELEEKYNELEEKYTQLEKQLAIVMNESREAKYELSTVEYSLKEAERQLLSADTRKSDYERQISRAERERDQLSGQVGELKNSIMAERAIVQSNLESQRIHYEAQFTGLQQKITSLQAQLGEQKETWAQKMQSQLNYYDGIRKQLEADAATLAKKHQETLQLADKKREEELKAKDARFLEELQRTRTQYDQKLQKERQDHELALKHHAGNLQEKIDRLESDLVDNSDDFRPATDDSLKTSYGKLKLMVETVTEPFNLGAVTVPQGFDAHNFLAREGKGQTRVLLRSIVWNKILEGFFSSPLGFGSFGPAHGKKLLLDTYSAWRKLFGEDPIPASSFYLVLERFRTDKEANKWRSATFQSVLMAVAPKGQKKNQAANGHLVKPFAENRQKVHDEILGVLAQVCNDPVQSEIAEKIVEIVQLAGELALEFGSQRAELALDTPAKGETITIGPEFIDCEDGESERGRAKEVELLVLPKLFRIGDGRNDLTTRKIIVQGEIYPVRS